MERCGKRNASNSGADSWTGIGGVAGFCTVVLIVQWPHRRNGEVTWRSALLQRLQEVRGNCKTRNQLEVIHHRITIVDHIVHVVYVLQHRRLLVVSHHVAWGHSADRRRPLRSSAAG